MTDQTILSMYSIDRPDKKLSKAERQRVAVKIIDNHFLDKYLVYRNGEGITSLYKIISDLKEVKPINKEMLVGDACNLLHDTIFFDSIKKIMDYVELWIQTTQSCLDEAPKSFAFSNDDSYTIKRLDFEVAKGECPVFDFFISRTQCNGEELKAYIWSLFEPLSSQQQYLWMKGEGSDGKGSLIRFLNKIFGESSTALETKQERLTALCHQKRLGVFNDVNNTLFPMSSVFKQLTGGDRVVINEKYRKQFSTFLDTKFIFTANRKPSFTKQKSDQRRCIYVEFKPIQDGEMIDDYENKIWEERGALLYKCKEAYEELTEDHIIICDIDSIEDVGDDFEIDYSVIFDRYFVLDEKASLTPKEVYEEVMGSIHRAGIDWSAFQEWLQRTYNIKKAHPRDKRVFKGIAFKNN